MDETGEGNNPYQSPVGDPLNQRSPLGEETEQTGLRIAVVVAVVVLVLFGLYWGGKLLLMPGDKDKPANEGAEVIVEAKCSDPTVYTDINVALSNAEAVCKIDLSGQNLAALPISIGYFSNLVELDISNNEISGLPSEIGWLRQLEKFDASNNKLPSLALEIGWLRKLKEWDLSNNQLTWLPSEIGWLVEMENLNLANNRLAAVPIDLGWMAKMKKLDLSGNSPDVAASADRLRPYMSGANIVLPQ